MERPRMRPRLVLEEEDVEVQPSDVAVTEATCVPSSCVPEVSAPETAVLASAASAKPDPPWITASTQMEPVFKKIKMTTWKHFRLVETSKLAAGSTRQMERWILLISVRLLARVSLAVSFYPKTGEVPALISTILMMTLESLTHLVPLRLQPEMQV